VVYKEAQTCFGLPFKVFLKRPAHWISDPPACSVHEPSVHRFETPLARMGARSPHEGVRSRTDFLEILQLNCKISELIPRTEVRSALNSIARTHPK